MNYRYLGRLAGLCLLLVKSLNGFSQLSDSLYRLEEVQIVSDRLGMSESRTGRHITVMKSSEIQALPVNSIDELLRYVPFLEVQSRGPFGAQSDILMRGSTFNQVLVLIDGMRINDPLTGHFNSNIPVSLTEISRIEVYRGPASVVYGPDAVGGVVNIITNSFEPGRDGEDGIEGKIEAWYGQHNLRRTNSGMNLQKGKWKAGAGVSYSASDGHALDQDSLRGDFSIFTASVSLSGELSEKINLAFRSAYDNRLFNARYFYTNSPMDQSREEVSKWWNQARLRIRLNQSHSITLMAGYQSTRDSFLFNPMFPANIHNTHFQNYQVNHLFLHENGFRLASGLQIDNRKILSKDRGDHRQFQTGAYFIVSKVYMNNLSLSTGLRLEYNQVYGLEALPQLNVSYTANKWIFRGSVGRSIRSPDFTERYISTGLEGPLSPGRNLGNPDLLSEKSWTLEGGVDRKISKAIDFRMTGFYRLGRDLIDYVMTPYSEIPDKGNLIPGEQYFYTRNIGLLNTAGIEAELNGKHFLPGEWVLEWLLSYQGLVSRSDSAVVSKYLAAHSRNLINGGLGLNSGSFQVRINAMYKNRDPWIVREISQNLTKSYMLWNIRMDKYLWQNRLQLSFQVNNLLDENYTDIMGAKMPGRWIQGGISLNFHR